MIPIEQADAILSNPEVKRLMDEIDALVRPRPELSFGYIGNIGWHGNDTCWMLWLKNKTIWRCEIDQINPQRLEAARNLILAGV